MVNLSVLFFINICLRFFARGDSFDPIQANNSRLRVHMPVFCVPIGDPDPKVNPSWCSWASLRHVVDDARPTNPTFMTNGF